VSVSDRNPPRQVHRLGLYAPLLALAAATVAWSLGWLLLESQIGRRMETERRAWSAQGGEISWASRRIYGFPFRLDVDLTGAYARDASGRGVLAPVLQAEAFVFAPTHWVAVAPRGVVLTRANGEPVVVGAHVLRASLSDFGAHPPRLSVEGIGLSFATPKSAKPYFISAASRLQIHTRSGPDNQGAVFVHLDGAQPQFGGLFARIAQGRAFSLTVDGAYSHASALTGPDWASAVRAWSDAGGTLTVRRARIVAGNAVLDAGRGDLTVGVDGRLQGAITASLRQAPRILAAMGEAGAVGPAAAATAASVLGAQGGRPVVTVTIDFQAGQTTLGPVAIGPAPKVY
jgi:hypothetical protein